ncbi:TatD family hydrolase [Candidatus Micrarchaeota archaeon]|nr:TatD family hydrolase [Candidatus Micrarchaeota archaeon]
MIDSHAHLDSKDFNRDLKVVIDRALTAGVGGIVNPATSLNSNKKCLEIARMFRGVVFACAGLDPVYAVKEKSWIEEVADHARRNRKEIVGVGEVGLEYKWMPSSAEEQNENFAFFIRLANELGKPVIVHARNAMTEALEILENENAERVVLHYFSGSRTQAREAVRRGYWVSFATNYCFMGDKKVIKEVPLDRMLVETDSPYSSPRKDEPRNEPANLVMLVNTIAKALGSTPEEVGEATERNAREAFRL